MIQFEINHNNNIFIVFINNKFMYVCIFKNFPIKIFKFKNIRSVFVCGSILNGQVFLDECGSVFCGFLDVVVVCF